YASLALLRLVQTRLANTRIGLFLAILLLRAPGFVYGVVDIDETDWLTYAQTIRRGALFYVDIVEKKPPLGFYFYALFSPLGFHMWPAQIAAIFWVFLTALAVKKAVAIWTEDQDAGWVGAWICAFASACNVFSVNGEMMLNLPIAVAILLYLKASKARALHLDLLSGVAIGIAAGFKHQAGIELVALGLALLFERALLRAIVLGLGFALPWAAMVGVWAALGHLDAFIE